MLILQIFEIIGFVYQYIKLLRQVSPQKWIFQELQDIWNICFRFVEEQPQDDYASELAGFFVSESARLSYLSASIGAHKIYFNKKQIFCLVGNLLLYPAEHVISAQCGYEIWDEELIEYVLSFFRPDNMRMDVISKFSTMSKGNCLPFYAKERMLLVHASPSKVFCCCRTFFLVLNLL